MSLRYFFQLFIAFIACLPNLLFAYLGHFSRMMSDDYCFIAAGHEYGGWGGTVYWFNNWEGSYSAFFWRSTFAVLDTMMPAVMPSIVIIMWVIALMWLLHQILMIWNIKLDGILIFALSNILVFATLNGLHSLQSIFWYSPTVEYTLPVPLLIGLIAFIVFAIRYFDSRHVFVISALVVGIVSFLIGGFAESHAVFQITLFAIMFFFVVIVYPSHHKGSLLLLLGGGVLGSIASLFVQLTSPGMAARFAVELERSGQTSTPLSMLVPSTIMSTFELTSGKTILSGFVIFFVLMMILTLWLYKPQYHIDARKPLNISVLQIVIWIILQLGFIPLLILHTSNTTSILGRYSYPYFMGILLNIVFIFLGILMLVRRHYLNSWLASHPKQLHRVYMAVLVFMGALFAITQLVPLERRVVIFITYTIVVMILLLISHFAFAFDNRNVTLYTFVGIGIGVSVWILSSSVISASIYGTGRPTERILSPVTFSLILYGGLCGLMFGSLLKSLYQAERFFFRLNIPIITLFVFIGCAIIIAGSMVSYWRDVGDFQLFATAWQARHEEILQQRESEKSIIQVSALPFQLEDVLHLVDLSKDPANRCAVRYYDVSAIQVES